ncbi:unnamed protein product [Musa banksii]
MESVCGCEKALSCELKPDLVGSKGTVSCGVSLISLACEQGRIKEVILVLNEIGYLSISSSRSNIGRVFLKLKELHGSGVSDTENKIRWERCSSSTALDDQNVYVALS